MDLWKLTTKKLVYHGERSKLRFLGCSLKSDDQLNQPNPEIGKHLELVFSIDFLQGEHFLHKLDICCNYLFYIY